jgi:hypothetical protein
MTTPPTLKTSDCPSRHNPHRHLVLGVRCGSWVILVALWWAQIPFVPLVPFPSDIALSPLLLGVTLVLMPALQLAWAVVRHGARPIPLPRQLASAGLRLRWFHAQADTWSLEARGWPGYPILVSRGPIERMPAPALLALVHHELAHHRFADVIVLNALFFGAWWLTDTALLAGAVSALVSRWMEYRADAYAARRTSPEHLLQALTHVLRSSWDRSLPWPLHRIPPDYLPVVSLWQTHPPLGWRMDRLRRLEAHMPTPHEPAIAATSRSRPTGAPPPP